MVILLLCAAAFGQAAGPATRPETFHVRGTITDPLDAVVPGAKVTLQNEQLNKVVDTNNAGIYEADLPLGSYTMMVQMRGFRLYRRPLFRVTTAPSNIILNATLLVGDPCGDMIVVNSSGEPATNEQYIAATEHCRREQYISVPSKDGVPFELSIRYENRATVGNDFSYAGERTGIYKGPVFVAYNLFSLRADEVVYSPAKRTMKARGHVLVTNESGAEQHTNSAIFRIEDGRAIPLQ
jgi:hypothetical protein